MARQCEGKVLQLSEFKSLVISMQTQLKQSVTAKKCKVSSLTLEPTLDFHLSENILHETICSV